MRIALRFLDEELEEPRLRHDHDVWERRRQTAEHAGRVRAARRDELERRRLDVRQLVQPLREADLRQNLERRRMDRVAAEVALEIAMRLEQRHGHAGAREQQRQHDAARSGADDTASRVMAQQAANPSEALRASQAEGARSPRTRRRVFSSREPPRACAVPPPCEPGARARGGAASSHRDSRDPRTRAGARSCPSARA